MAVCCRRQTTIHSAECSSFACTRWLKAMCTCAQGIIADESQVRLRTRSSMFDDVDVARARLILMLPGLLLYLCLTRKCELDIVVVAIAQCDENMLCSRARGVTVQHSLFVVANSCCRCCRCAMRYENAGCSRPRPCRRHSLSSSLLLLLLLSRNAMYMPRVLALRILSSTYVVVAAVINSLCACAQWLMGSSCACARWLMDSSCACP